MYNNNSNKWMYCLIIIFFSFMLLVNEEVLPNVIKLLIIYFK